MPVSGGRMMEARGKGHCGPVFPGVRGSRSGLTCTHAAPCLRGQAAMTVTSGDRAAQSATRARQWGRLVYFGELARGLAPLPGW